MARHGATGKPAEIQRGTSRTENVSNNAFNILSMQVIYS
jgi:hypothetical protein